MSSRAKTLSNRRNARLSTGPSKEARQWTRFNGVKHGMRSAVQFLPGEEPERFQRKYENWVRSARPRGEMGRDLLLRCVRAYWMTERIERAQDARVAAHIEQAGDREDVEVAGLIKRLFWDHRGPHAMYALSSVATGGPPSSWTGDVNDPNEPLVVLKWLEATAKGCLALLGEWRKLLERIEQGLGWQSHDRLKAIRMLGRQPTDAAEDKRIVQIFVGAFAVKPSIKRKAYDDLKAEMATLDFKAFVNRVRDRWPMVVDASETTKARDMLIDLVTRNIERLEAKLEVFEARSEELNDRNAALLALDKTTDGQIYQRYEMACQRKLSRCLADFWKYQRETEDDVDVDEDDEGEAIVGFDGTEDAEDYDADVEVEGETHAENENATSEAKPCPDASEAEANHGVVSVFVRLANAVQEAITTSNALDSGVNDVVVVDATISAPGEMDFVANGPPEEVPG